MRQRCTIVLDFKIAFLNSDTNLNWNFISQLIYLPFLKWSSGSHAGLILGSTHTGHTGHTYSLGENEQKVNWSEQEQIL